MYTTVIAENWKLDLGQKSGISQNAFHNGQDFVWNFPFEMTLETSQPHDWPQMVVVLYGKDFFGRSVAKGYGNLHLPGSAGTHSRKIRLFDTIPPNTTATCCAFLMGYINELKQPEKVLTQNDRAFLQTKPIG
jgi:B9 domain-containing protein 1